MPQNLIACAQWRRRRLPTFVDSDGQQLFGSRTMIPHGDRRDRAISGRAENKEQSILPATRRRDHIVRVFVLSDGFQQPNWRPLAAAPDDKLLQRAQQRQFSLQRGESLRRQISLIDDFHGYSVERRSHASNARLF